MLGMIVSAPPSYRPDQLKHSLLMANRPGRAVLLSPHSPGIRLEKWVDQSPQPSQADHLGQTTDIVIAIAQEGQQMREVDCARILLQKQDDTSAAIWFCGSSPGGPVVQWGLPIDEPPGPSTPFV
jgi:hypothetical protein